MTDKPDTSTGAAERLAVDMQEQMPWGRGADTLRTPTPAPSSDDLAKVEALVGAVRHEREMVCQDMGMQLKASEAVDAALAAMKGGDT
jgi:hypothetical protein